jgi:hypothetical protein
VGEAAAEILPDAMMKRWRWIQLAEGCGNVVRPPRERPQRAPAGHHVSTLAAGAGEVR